MTIWRTRVECWITKGTKTHSEYVILIAFHCNNGCTGVLIILLPVGKNILFDASLFVYINSTNIPPIMIINRIYENQNLLSL